tara:strand:- start:240 stop:1493 length:1254 start_codon:yes stop_codon:yes gene_type:complete
MTLDSSWTTRSANNQGFTGQNSNGAWSAQMNSLNIGGNDSGSGANRTYSWSITFQSFGKQQFRTAVDDTGSIFINGVFQFNSGGFGGWTLRETPNNFAPGTYTISMSSVNSGGGPWGMAADWVGVSLPPPPSITSFYGDPNPQNSSTSGSPSYSTTLYWTSNSTTSITSAKITSNVDNISLPNSASGNTTITNLPQSSNNNTPATRTYTLELCNASGCDTQPLEVNVRNDNTPSNTWTTLHENIEPNQTNATKSIGTLSGVDMVVKVETTANVATFSSSVDSGFNNPQYFTNGQTIYLRTTGAPYNTDVSNLPVGSEFGKFNNKVIPVTVGSLDTFNVTFQTKKPKIKENFDFSSITGIYPYEDIDLIVNDPQLEFYVQTGTVTIDDVDIPVEIRSDNPNTQVLINNSNTWKNIREI